MSDTQDTRGALTDQVRSRLTFEAFGLKRSTNPLDRKAGEALMALLAAPSLPAGDGLMDALREIKSLVCGDRFPRWGTLFATDVTRGKIADIVDEALAAPRQPGEVGAGVRKLTNEQILKIRDSIKYGDGWDGDQWDLALARAIEQTITIPRQPVGTINSDGLLVGVGIGTGSQEPVDLEGRICEHCGNGSAVLTFEDGQFASNCDDCCADTDYFLVERLNQLIAASPMGAEMHPDDIAVDRFAAMMKIKLRLAREKGRTGWEQCTAEDLTRMLREHVEKGDPRDVANFCMFLWHNGSPILPAACKKCGGQKWIFRGNGEDTECEACIADEGTEDPAACRAGRGRIASIVEAALMVDCPNCGHGFGVLPAASAQQDEREAD